MKRKFALVQDPKHGEITCQEVLKSGKNKGQPCEHGAYFKSNGKYLCGQHSKRDRHRVELVKMSAREKKEVRCAKIAKVSQQVIYHESNPSVLKTLYAYLPTDLALLVYDYVAFRQMPTLFRMAGRFAKVPNHPGCLNVFPNFKSSWQGIGLVLPGLSPMSLGPVFHGQPGLPPAKNIENMHQYNKHFPECETAEEFVENRRRGYLDSTPHRHKFPEHKVNIPKYFVWIDRDGTEKHLTYIESRQFYCNFFERLVLKHPEFLRLKEEYDKGAKLYICGPDAYPMEPHQIEQTYLDSTHPFGHERVLYTMLVVENPSKWPWRIHKTFDF